RQRRGNQKSFFLRSLRYLLFKLFGSHVLSPDADAGETEDKGRDAEENCRADEHRDQEKRDRIMTRGKVVVPKHHEPVKQSDSDDECGDDQHSTGESEGAQRIVGWWRFTHAIMASTTADRALKQVQTGKFPNRVDNVRSNVPERTGHRT